MDGKVILGIHSQVRPDVQRDGNAYERFIDGHAWLSVTRDGKTEVYGLWPDSHTRVRDNGDGTDIRVGMERRFKSDADRYVELTPEQAVKLEAALKANVTWSPTTTCAGWASDTMKTVTGREINATEFMSIETPRELIRTIRALEHTEPTTLEKPRAPIAPQQGSSSNSFSDARGAADVPPAFAALHQSSVDAVSRLEARLGRQPDQNSACMAASLTCLAARSGIDRIDHALLSIQSEQARAGENVFIVKGDPNDPAKLRAHMKTQDAIAVPVEEFMSRLAALEQASPQRRQEQQVQQPQQEQAPRRTLT